MRHVILYGEEDGPSRGLGEALRAAGVKTTRAGEPPPSAEGNGSAPALAVLFDVAAGAGLAGLHAAVERAAAEWPDTPVVACQRDPEDEPASASQRLDASTLKRLGFHAVAAEPAQLSAVLREVEEQVLGRGRHSQAAPEVAPASLLLPERLATERLRAAFEVVASLHFATDQRSAAATALAGLAALARADRWTIYLLNETGHRGEALFEPLAARGLTPSERVVPEGDWRRALMGDALALAGTHSRAAREAAATAETVRRREGARRVVAVPLVAGERVIGILEAVREGSEARLFTEADASLLSALALPVAAALSNSARVAEAERLSQTDDLTKLHNARYLSQYLVGELKRARRYGSMVTTIFLDLDDFKRVNDVHGHLVGSHVLMEMAGVILSSVRDTDVVARYGGDEFVVVLPETGIEQGLRVAERVRSRISRYTFNGGRSLSLTLTASFGVAAFPQHAQSPQQLIASADTAMYEAKAARKNCIRFAGIQT
jgi:diguanylate cyclase (GGDEF)-like protein